MRTPIEEIAHRCALRKRYFEDPDYRRWSDIVPDYGYDSWRDDVLFIEYIANNTQDGVSRKDLYELLENGHDLPINWGNLYAYFDERFNDPDNYFHSDLTAPKYFYVDEPSNKEPIADILNRYRDKLLSATYDII